MKRIISLMAAIPVIAAFSFSLMTLTATDATPQAQPASNPPCPAPNGGMACTAGQALFCVKGDWVCGPSASVSRLCRAQAPVCAVPTVLACQNDRTWVCVKPLARATR